MRLGVIEFGSLYAETAPLLTALRERGVDVITKLEEPPAQSPRDEAERLQRAECDGVLLTTGDGVVPDDVAEALLFIHCPILRVGTDEANPIIAALAVAVDSQDRDRLTADIVEPWLQENVRASRQKGIEAAHKLYGTRLFVGRSKDVNGFALKVRWLQQFGILVREEPIAGKVRADDIVASDANVLGALTQRLLCLISGLPEVVTMARSQLSPEPIPSDHIIHTILLLTPSRVSESSGEPARNFYSRIFRGTEIAENTYAVGKSVAALLMADGDIAHSVFYAIPGDFVGAVRAALNTLDIPTVVLRDV